MRKVWDSIPGWSNRRSVANGLLLLRRLCVFQALSRGDGPSGVRKRGVGSQHPPLTMAKKYNLSFLKQTDFFWAELAKFAIMFFLSSSTF